MINNIPEKYNQLILITSESCNLSCNYCVMANQINKERHKNEAIKVKESFLNGEYEKTIDQLFSRLNLDYTKIQHMSLWGQEPTLTLNEFSYFFPNLYNKFPNFKDIFFSTNIIAFPERIVNFIKTVSNTIQKPFTITIQFSYDGKESTLNQRKIDPNIILNNIRSIILEINKMNLSENLSIKFTFHCVVNDTIINKFGTKNYNKKELYEYWKEFSDIKKDFQQLNTSKQLSIRSFSPATLIPFNASVEEGQKLSQFYKNTIKIDDNSIEKIWNILLQTQIRNSLNFPYEIKGKELISKMMTLNYSNIKFLPQISSTTTCNANYSNFKIRYDGTFVHCQSAIMGLSKEELQGNEGTIWDIQKYKLEKNFYPNIFSSSDIELEKYFYQIKMASTQSFPLLFSESLNLMTLLLKANQIDPTYNDLEKRIKHAYFITMTNCCPHNNIMETGSLIGRSTGWIRFLCNGFMDIAEQEYFKKIGEFKHGN